MFTKTLMALTLTILFTNKSYAEDTKEKLTRDYAKSIYELAKTLDSVKDKATAKAAVKKLMAHTTKREEIDKRVKALGLHLPKFYIAAKSHPKYKKILAASQAKIRASVVRFNKNKEIASVMSASVGAMRIR